MKLGVIVVTAAASLFIAASCASRAPAPQKSQTAPPEAQTKATTETQAVSAAPLTWTEERNRNIHRDEILLSRFDEKISSLKKDIAGKKGNARKQDDQLVKEFQDKVNDVRKKMEDYRVATSDNVAQRKQDLDTALAKAEDMSKEANKKVATRK